MVRALIEHDVENVRLELQEGEFVLVCGCGWRSEPHGRATDAARCWEAHQREG